MWRITKPLLYQLSYVGAFFKNRYLGGFVPLPLRASQAVGGALRDSHCTVIDTSKIHVVEEVEHGIAARGYGLTGDDAFRPNSSTLFEVPTNTRPPATVGVRNGGLCRFRQ